MPSLEQATCANMPVEALAVLAGLRGSPDLKVQVIGERVWLRWPAQDGQVLPALLPVPGAEFYVWHEGRWYRPGSRLPVDAVPALDLPVPLHQVLTPSPVLPVPPSPRVERPVELRLVRSDRPRVCTAMSCKLSDLARWADTAPAAEIEELFAAHSGEDVLLMGKHLPATPRGQRYWGKNLLIPLGYRPQPGLPERDLLVALGVREDEIGLLRLPHAEVSEDDEAAVLDFMPAEAFELLTRAGIRLALKEFARP